MKLLYYEPKEYLPGIILDKQTGKFEFYGKTCPEDAVAFYEPVFDWLDEYTKEPLEKTVFDFRLTYFNTVSSKILMMIMMRLEEMNEAGNDVKIRWFYPEEDDDLAEAGNDFSGLLEIDFEMIPYNEDNTYESENESVEKMFDSLL
jgi:hypothetical protein